GALPACAGVAVFNALWYGSALNTGRPALDYIYRWENFWPNLVTYPTWLFETQTPVVALAVVAPFVLRRRLQEQPGVRGSWALAVTYLVFAAVTFASYVLFFQVDVWWYLRYLLPAFPPLFALTSVVLIAVIARYLPRVTAFTVVVLVTLLAAHGIDYARHNA